MMGLAYTDYDIEGRVPMVQPDSLKDNTCTRKVITYDEEGDIAPPVQQTASHSSGEAIIRTTFVWPELHD